MGDDPSPMVMHGVTAAMIALLVGAVVPAAGAPPVRVDPPARPPQERVADPLVLAYQATVAGGLATAATCINHADASLGGPTGGVLDLSGVPPGATIVHAVLYWSVLSPVSPVDTGAPTFDGIPLVPVLVAEVPRTPCFATQSFTGIFRADVAALVPGDGSYRLTGFPGTGTQLGVLTEGATLLVVFCALGSPEVDVVIWEGAEATNDGNRLFTQALSGFVAASSGTLNATLVLAAGNGQGREPPEDDGDPLIFNGVDLDQVDPTILSGALCQIPGNFPEEEGLYDHTVLDVSALVPPGSTSATLEIRSPFDCYTIGAVALVVTTDPGRAVPEPSALDVRPSAPPLRVTRAPSLRITWEDVGSPSNLYRGDIGSWYSHGAAGGVCGVPAAAATVAEEPGDHYFLAVAVGCGGVESSAGRDSLGRERPTALAASGDPCPC